MSARSEVTILDAGVGNLANVRRAFAAVGAEASVTRDAAAITQASRIVLPGVGAFRPPREALRGELEQALRAALERGARLLGICVGCQLLFEGSEEFGATDGLGLVPGRVTALPDEVTRPHVGWNRLTKRREDPLFEGIDDGAEVYFVHSFAPEEVPEVATVATALHGREFAAWVATGRVTGVQFHPEKSGDVGLRILRNFVELPA